MGTQLIRHPQLGEITLCESPRAGRISLSVKPTGTVRLSYPAGSPREAALRFLESRIAWVCAAREKMARRHPALLPRLPEAEQRREVERLRAAAHADLPARIEKWAQLTGLSYTKMTIRAARTKWGSCSGRNTISLSLYLMTLPEHLRDFVIIHELCHTRHHDHSPRFHALVDRMTGGREKELTRELRGYCIR